MILRIDRLQAELPPPSVPDPAPDEPTGEVSDESQSLVSSLIGKVKA